VKFAIEHVFARIDRAGYEALYFDETFNAALGDALGLGRQLVRLDRGPDRIVRHVRCEPRREAGSAADQAFGTSRASYLEEMDYDLRRGTGAWRTIPNLFTDRVKNAGTLEIASVPGGVRRVVRGEVAVRLFGFGRLVERMIVAEIEKSYAGAAEFTTRWLAAPR
jgi:Protein of unknown function (DUF2505)